MGFDLNNYVPVNERINEFYKQYPDGRILCHVPQVLQMGDRTFIQVTAEVYREPNDPKPCIATAWEAYPGKTPYTKDSEMMNCETSAVGRALGFAGIATNHSIASREEVQNRRSEPKVQLAPNEVIQDLRIRMDHLPEDVRKTCKQEYLTRFGKPNSLTVENIAAAQEFVASYEDQADLYDDPLSQPF